MTHSLRLCALIAFLHLGGCATVPDARLAIMDTDEIVVSSGSPNEGNTAALEWEPEALLGAIVDREESAYAHSDKNHKDVARIYIPNDYTYRSHSSREWTGRGDRSWSDGVVRRRSDQKIIEVWLKVSVPEEGLGSKNNWIGRLLAVRTEHTG